jgi:hypothetical protein
MMMKNKAKIIALTIALLLVLASTSGAGSSTQYAIEWDVAAAGDTPMASSAYGLTGTIGQPAEGISNSSNYALCAGYWCGLDVDYTILLPLILRDT